MPSFEYQHTVAFEETNLVGNVYFSHLISWQGRCREMFLRECAPGLLAEIADGFCLVTTRCSCEYLAELAAFDEVVVRMKLTALTQNQLRMGFEYWRRSNAGEELVARGDQSVACMRRERGRLVPTPVPPVLFQALGPYMGDCPK
jgi:enediyne biosynthesis thioesterase